MHSINDDLQTKNGGGGDGDVGNAMTDAILTDLVRLVQ